MNPVARGVKNAFRNGVRTVAVVLILALALGLALAMLVAKQAVEKKISSVKASVGNTITISPAGMSGFGGGFSRGEMGGGSGAPGEKNSGNSGANGNVLSSDDLAKVKKLAHVTAASAILTARVTSGTDTNLSSPTPSFARKNSSATEDAPARTDFKFPVMAIGIDSADGISMAMDGANFSLKSGAMIHAKSADLTAVVGDSIASENKLSAGSTFTLYGKNVKVVGILNSGNATSQDSAPGRNSSLGSAVILPLATLQNLSGDSGSINKITATVDSVENTAAATAAITKALGTDSDGNNIADVTSDESAAQTTLDALGGISTTATISLVAAGLAAAVIIFLTMLMVVRERRGEIGVLKAIGAKSRIIITQFVAESLVLTALASVIGLGIGIAAATPLTNTLVASAQNSSASNSGNANNSGRPERGFGGFAKSSQRALGTVSASVNWSIVLEALGAAILIAAVGATAASLAALKVRPAEAIRAE